MVCRATSTGHFFTQSLDVTVRMRSGRKRHCVRGTSNEFDV